MTLVRDDNETILNVEAVAGRPVLFLDVDGVLQPYDAGEYAIDASTITSVYYTVKGLGAVLVCCSSRVSQDPHPVDVLDRYGLPRWMFVGQCDPGVCPDNGESVKTQMVLDWLMLADQHGVRPTRFAILDDARTFGWHPILGSHHVKPEGPIAMDADLAKVWDMLDPDGERRRPRAYRQGES